MSYVKRIGWIALLALVLLVAGNPAASAQNCTVTRSQVEADVLAGATPEELQAKYAGCVSGDSTSGAASAFELEFDESEVDLATGQTNTQAFAGNTSWEKIQACGYHPQREEAVCAIDILRTTGFGGRICVAPGSTEYVLLCVTFPGGGLVPVHTGTVHVHDANAGAVPPWDFGVVIQANPRLAALANNGATLPARAILSWAIPPANCNAVPIWGNAVNFRIRLDP